MSNTVGVYVVFSIDGSKSWLFNMPDRKSAEKWCKENTDLLDRGNTYQIGKAVII